MKARLGLLLAAASLGACGGKTKTAAEPPVQIIEGLAMALSQGGRPTWEMRAERAFLRDGQRTAELVRPGLTLYRQGRLASTLAAAGGTLDTETSDVLLSSSVVVTSKADGAVLKTEELRYSSSEGRFVTDREVDVTRPGGRLKGRGLEASADLSDIRVFNQRAVIERTP